MRKLASWGRDCGKSGKQHTSTSYSLKGRGHWHLPVGWALGAAKAKELGVLSHSRAYGPRLPGSGVTHYGIAWGSS